MSKIEFSELLGAPAVSGRMARHASWCVDTQARASLLDAIRAFIILAIEGDGLVANHPWPRASVNLAKLLLYQWTNAVLVPPMGIVPRQIFSANYSRLMGASFVALMGDAFVCRKHRQTRPMS